MKELLKIALLLFVLIGTGLLNDPIPADDQEDSADNGWCFTITLDEDNGPDRYLYEEYACDPYAPLAVTP